MSKNRKCCEEKWGRVKNRRGEGSPVWVIRKSLWGSNVRVTWVSGFREFQKTSVPYAYAHCESPGHGISQTNWATEPFFPTKHLPWSVLTEHTPESGDWAQQDNSTGQKQAQSRQETCPKSHSSLMKLSVWLQMSQAPAPRASSSQTHCRPCCVHSPTGKLVPLIGSLHPLLTASWPSSGCFPKFLPPVWMEICESPPDHSEAAFTQSQKERTIPLSLCSNATGLGNDAWECLKLGW